MVDVLVIAPAVPEVFVPAAEEVNVIRFGVLKFARFTKSKPQMTKAVTETLLKPREAALELRISFPTIKQWIYRIKIRSIRTVGGHHRIPQSEIDRLLFRTGAKTAPERALVMRRLSGRNQSGERSRQWAYGRGRHFRLARSRLRRSSPRRPPAKWTSKPAKLPPP